MDKTIENDMETGSICSGLALIADYSFRGLDIIEV